MILKIETSNIMDQGGRNENYEAAGIREKQMQFKVAAGF